MIWIVVIVVVLVLFAILSVCLAAYAVHGKRFTLDEAWDWQMEHVPETRMFHKEDFSHYTIQSYDGYELHASLLPAKEPSNRYMILAHGYTDARFGMLKYMPIFVEENFNCILYDERGHGENKKAPCSFGIREAKDLKAVIEDTHARYGDDITLGLIGESLGGATVMNVMQYKPKVNFVIDDCGFADIVNVLKKSLKDQTPFPQFMVYPASVAARIVYGASFTAARPADSLKDSEVPLLVIHGGADDFIVPDNGKRASEANKGYHEFHVIDGATHAASVLTDRPKYTEIVKKFIEKTCGQVREKV